MSGPTENQTAPQFEFVFRGKDMQDLNKVDFSNFLSTLTSHLAYWGIEGYQSGSMKVEFERTHEWELVFTLILVKVAVVGGLFAAGFLPEFGKEVAKRLSQKLFRDQKLHAEVKTEEQKPGTPVDPKTTIDELAKILNISPDSAAKEQPIVRRVIILDLAPSPSSNRRKAKKTKQKG